jgi:hypothetical protein
METDEKMCLTFFMRVGFCRPNLIRVVTQRVATPRFAPAAWLGMVSLNFFN